MQAGQPEQTLGQPERRSVCSCLATGLSVRRRVRSLIIGRQIHASHAGGPKASRSLIVAWVNEDGDDEGSREIGVDSIDIQDPSLSYADRADHDESSLVDGVVTAVVLGDQELTWHVIEGATKRGGAHLVNSLGFTYVRHKQSTEGDAQY